MAKKSIKISNKGSDYIKRKEDTIQDKTYITKEVETSIALLDSCENNVVLEALLFLSKYGDIKDENLLYLQSHGILPKILQLLNRNVCILRMTLRLLGILLKIDETVCEMDQDLYDSKILDIVDMFISHPDQYVRDFCFPILARLATSNRISCLIFQADLFTPIFKTLEESENDQLIKDTLDLLYILLNAPAALALLPDLKVFNPLTILKHLENPDVEMQAKVLEIIRKLTFFQVEAIQKMFREAKLVERMFNVIMDNDWRKHHNKALSILTNCMDSEGTNSYFVDTFEFIKFCQWIKTCEPEFLPLCSAIVYKLTQIAELRQILFDLSVEDSILLFFRSTEKNVLNYACKAVSNMTEHTYCCRRMLTPVILKELLLMLQREYDDEDPENEVALKTLYDFVIRNYVLTTQMLSEYGGVPVILDYLKKGTEKLSEDSFSRVLHLLNMISVHPDYQKSIMNDEFFEEILKHVSSNLPGVVKAAAEIVTNFIPLELFRDYFITHGGPVYFLDILKNTKCVQLFKSLLVFIHTIMIYKNVAEAFLHAKLIKVLKDMPSNVRINAPLIDRILKLVYSLYLPIKLFETGRLDVMDKFKDRFYIVTGYWPFPFPFLEIFEAEEKCPINTVYVVDYSYKNVLIEKEDAVTTSEHTLPNEDASIMDFLYESESVHTMNFGYLSQDPFLPRYIHHIQQFLDDDICLSHRIKLLAEYVETLLCGPKPDLILTQKLHNFKLHIQALKEKLGTNVIPIGYLRVGFHCERALLFKAIADRVAIPTSYVKGRGNIYWNEVALMSEYDGDCDETGLCGKLEIYIVDLMVDIGKLLPVGSREANAYCKIVC